MWQTFTNEGLTAITEQEVSTAAQKMQSAKVPRPDHVLNELIRIAVEVISTFFIVVLNACLQEGRFPGEWTVVRKPNKCGNESSSFRLICHMVIAARLVAELETGENLSKNQFWFKEGTSTV